MLNELLHNIVTHLPIASEAGVQELQAMVDEAVPPGSAADTPAPDTGTPGVTVDTTKGA